MTGAAGHLVSHSGYGSLIVPGVLLKERAENSYLPGKKVLCRERRGKQRARFRAGDAPTSAAPSPWQPQHAPLPAARWPGPHLYLSAPPPISAPPVDPPGPSKALEQAAGERTPKASHPKERKQKGCSSRRRDIGHVGPKRRHATPAPHLPDNPCTETLQLFGDQTSGSLKHPERLRTRKKKAASLAASEQPLKKPATTKIAESGRAAEDYTRGAAIGRAGGQKERRALIGCGAYKKRATAGGRREARERPGRWFL